MKKFTLLLAVVATLFSCEGPQGPPGFDGTNVVAQAFEVTTTFTNANDYRARFVYPNNIAVEPTDMILVYHLFDEAPANNGGTVDVWRLLPQTIFTNFGIFKYNFDFTNADVDLFLEAEAGFNYNNLTAADLNNQTFRVVILPVDLASNPLLNIMDYNSVANIAGLNESRIIQIQ